MDSTADVMVLLPMPDGSCAAFRSADVIEAKRRAAVMGFQGPAVPTTIGAPTVPERLLTSKGMAELLGVNDTLVEQMAKDGRVPSVRIGRLLRFEPAAVIAALRVGTWEGRT